MDFIAWDIETCPNDLDTLTPAQKNRYDLELAYKLNNSHVERTREEASRLVRSVHPFLGWICCISLVHGYEGGTNRTPISFTAHTQGEEEALLRSFWERVKEYRSRSVIWVTFNGKRFDVPFVVARSARYGIKPSRSDITDTYPFNNKPHTDLSGLWPMHYGLEELCEHLEVDVSKNGMDGSQVAGAVAEGRINDVKRYCEADALATLQCLQAAPHVVGM